MPGRKSVDTSVTARAVENGDGDEGTPAKTSKGATSELGVEDLNLPRSIINRLAKGILPPNTQIQKDALLAISKGATVFVSYLASSANDRAISAGKKTVQPKDVFEALMELEFEGFAGPCEAELTHYNKIQNSKRNDYRRRIREVKTGSGADSSAATTAENGETSPNGFLDKPSHENGDTTRDSPPATKRARTLGNGAADDYDSTLVENDDDGDGDTIDENEADEDEQSNDDDDEADEESDEEGRGTGVDIEDPIEVNERRLQSDDDDDAEEEDGSGSD